MMEMEPAIFKSNFNQINFLHSVQKTVNETCKFSTSKRLLLRLHALGRSKVVSPNEVKLNANAN